MSEKTNGIIELTDTDFDAGAVAEGWCLVDFYATWCPHCKAFRPDYEAFADSYGGPVKLYAADVDAAKNATKAHKVRSIPCLVLLRDGEIVKTKTGAMKPDALAAWIEEHVTD
ncbi:MAG: thioredoxin fold domain-containing protein [Armatimonadetes bacterium]|nr:thioredoxin fold domain-containing protein [Armatimonadota bacterium]